MATTPARTLDVLDHELIVRLRADGRASTRALAADLGVTEGTVAARLRRLAADGVLRIVAVAHAEAFGLPCMSVVFVRVGDRSPHDVAADVSQVAATTGVNVCSGGAGVVANVLTRDLAELAEVHEQLMSIRGVGAARTEMVVDTPRFDTRWSGRAFLHQHDLPRPAIADDHDDLDVALVTALQDDARLSNRRIAAQLGVSESTVRSRLRRLEDEGAIRIQAVCDVEHFGLGAHGYVTVRAAPGRLQEARDVLLDVPELGFISRTIGSVDFVAFAAAQTRERVLDLVMTDVAGHPAIAEVELFEGCGTYKHVFAWGHLHAPPG
ncbi:Lrp/AsnC family transcriptional regulator [Conexibacter sp. SYSU D00693]|uniref:Lrp/AsnC family transcriptional regulator n=1 Tax=Conexibacter sp. SYSU D00693 TaxID=2812560 RepID=UPI00196A3864|nr:Lrp/AsnC family transcriptional regulator [Conexibacter sp. SYSU D00693]